MKKTLRGFFFGVLVSLLFICSIPVFAQGINKTIKVVMNGTIIKMNGKTVAAENIVYNNKTYVQIDTISSLLGKDYSYESKTRIANIKDKQAKTTSTISPTPAPTPTPQTASPVPPAPSPTTNPVAFAGYFKNTNYLNPDIFKIPGEQTKADINIQGIAAGFNDKKDISTVQEIFKWIHANLTSGSGDQFGRYATDIINNKTTTGCTDNGLAFAAFSRAKGIPTVFVQTARMDWVKNLGSIADPQRSTIYGHILVEVLLSDNKWYLVDSTAGKLFYNYDKSNFSLSDGYYVFAKSIEVYDTGIKNVIQNNATMISIFKGFDISKYKDPMYEYMNLSTGSIQKSQEYTGMTGTTPQGQTVIAPQGNYIILGAKDPTLAFRNKLLSGVSVWAGSENLVTQNQLTNATVIDLHVKGTSFPSFLTEYFPDISSTTGNCSVYRYSGNGQKRILVIADSDADLLNWANNVSADFLNQ